MHVLCSANQKNTMSKVFVDMGISLDGFIAGDNRGPQNPLGDNGPAIHNWIYEQNAFWANMGMSQGKTGEENDLVRHTLARTGAYIMGKNMFDEGEANWPEDLYKTPVFVLTHRKREPWVQKGSTIFYFTGENLAAIVQKAKEAAGGKDVRIQGGANTIQQFLNANLVDECIIHQSPLLLHSGLRLFEQLDSQAFTLQIASVLYSSHAVHTQYNVVNKR